MKRLELEINGKPEVVFAEKIKNILWIHWQGRTLTYEPEVKGLRKKSSGAGVFEGELKAPMPGKITKLNAVVGAMVGAQETLLVMEAMKMEYAVKVPAAGKVESILCKVGDQVTLGQSLVKVKLNEKGNSP